MSVAKKNRIQHLLNAFDKFSGSTGLDANKDKSQVVVGDAQKAKNSKSWLK